MADTNHQVDRLKEQIDAGAAETKSYLDTVRICRMVSSLREDVSSS